MTASVVLFLVYLDRFVHSLRPVAVAWPVAAAGARVFQAARPARAGDRRCDRPPASPALVVRSRRGGRDPGDRPRRTARRRRPGTTACWSSRTRSATSSRTASGPVEVYGTGAPPAADRLRGMFALGEERTIEQDPAFALRILVDIAIRALSPAVNDPTTAVQVLGAIEDLLLLIGESDLSGAVRSATPPARCACSSRRGAGRTCSRSR